MKHIYAISNFQPITSQQLLSIFPQDFSIKEEDGRQILTIDVRDDITDEQIRCKVQQECDRLFFLTGVQLKTNFIRQEKVDGTITACATIANTITLIKKLLPEINRQHWDVPLSVQLRLWNLAFSPSLPIASKANFLFQIIEISYPDTRDSYDYPEYNDPNKEPHPRTEAKLLRHLMSHGRGKKIQSPELQRYCNHLGIQKEFHDPTDIHFLRVINSRMSILVDESRRIIYESITKKL